MFSILHKMRYRFEFTLLPGLLFTEPEAALQIDAPALYALWHLFSNGVETGEAPYREEDYKVRAVTGQEGVRMTVAEMPAPKTPPLCKRVYFCLNERTGTPRYITVEGDPFCGQDFLCECSRSGRHINYGSFPPLDPAGPDYKEALEAEARRVAKLVLSE